MEKRELRNLIGLLEKGGENQSYNLKSIKSQMDKKELKSLEREQFEQKILDLELENNRLRMTYENKF